MKIKDRDKETKETVKIFANINSQEYLQIPNTNFIIAEFEPDWKKGFDYEISHKKVLQERLQIPTPVLFMPHFVNVINAYHGNSKLCDATGNEVTGDRLKTLYEEFNHNHWSLLNAKFVQGNGFNNMDLETVTGLDADGNLIKQKIHLEKCLLDDCYVALEFNKQGLPTKKSRSQKYEHGENIYFCYPRDNSIAWFRTGSYWTDLYCGRDSSYSSALLKVFSVCETNIHNKI